MDVEVYYGGQRGGVMPYTALPAFRLFCKQNGFQLKWDPKEKRVDLDSGLKGRVCVLYSGAVSDGSVHEKEIAEKVQRFVSDYGLEVVFGRKGDTASREADVAIRISVKEMRTLEKPKIVLHQPDDRRELARSLQSELRQTGMACLLKGSKPAKLSGTAVHMQLQIPQFTEIYKRKAYVEKVAFYLASGILSYFQEDQRILPFAYLPPNLIKLFFDSVLQGQPHFAPLVPAERQMDEPDLSEEAESIQKAPNEPARVYIRMEEEEDEDEDEDDWAEWKEREGGTYQKSSTNGDDIENQVEPDRLEAVEPDEMATEAEADQHIEVDAEADGITQVQADTQVEEEIVGKADAQVQTDMVAEAVALVEAGMVAEAGEQVVAEMGSEADAQSDSVDFAVEDDSENAGDEGRDVFLDDQAEEMMEEDLVLTIHGHQPTPEQVEEAAASVAEQGVHLADPVLEEARVEAEVFFDYTLIHTDSEERPYLLIGTLQVKNTGTEALYNPIVCLKVNPFDSIKMGGQILPPKFVDTMAVQGSNGMLGWRYLHDDWFAQARERGEYWIAPIQPVQIEPKATESFQNFQISFLKQAAGQSVIVEGMVLCNDQEAHFFANNRIAITF